MNLIDAKGKACPLPVILAKKEIDAGADSFAIEVDNQTAVENLRRLADSQGYALGAGGGEGAFRLTFTKTGGAAAPDASECRPAPARSGNWAVFVGRDTIGGGSDELGRNLMRMYFYTMTESDGLPNCLLFMNGGVKLPAEDEQVVAHLKALSERGVEILVCGTCLNFYGIADKLQIGRVSNMYEIAERMRSSDKVVTL